MSDKPIAGEVYERDGKFREVVSRDSDADAYHVRWRVPPDGKVRECWCSTWLDWADKATLVYGVTNDD